MGGSSGAVSYPALSESEAVDKCAKFRIETNQSTERQSFLRASQHLALCWVFNFVEIYWSYSSMLLVHLLKTSLSFVF